MKSMEIYSILRPYNGEKVTIQINVGRSIQKSGILKCNETHITVIGNEACALIPICEEAGTLEQVQDFKGKVIYKSLSKIKKF